MVVGYKMEGAGMMLVVGIMVGAGMSKKVWDEDILVGEVENSVEEHFHSEILALLCSQEYQVYILELSLSPLQLK